MTPIEPPAELKDDQVLQFWTYNTTNWTADDLGGFVADVSSIHNAYCIIDKFEQGQIHLKVIDLLIEKLAEIFEKTSGIANIFKEENLGLPNISSKGISMRKLVMREAFNIIGQYLNDSEKLRIANVVMQSDGGIKFWTPDDKPTSPLMKTKRLIEGLAEQKNVEDLIKDFLIEFRIVDPRLVAFLKDVLYEEPINDIKRLLESRMVQMPPKNKDTSKTRAKPK